MTTSNISRSYWLSRKGEIGINLNGLLGSSETARDTHLEFAKFLPQYKQSRLIPVAQSPNNVAVVIWVELGQARALLGSDLEESGSSTLGWKAIVGSAVRPTSKAQLFKIAHHGSDTGHNDDVWVQMLEVDPCAVLSPFLKGSKKLPSADDVKRIKARTPHLYSTALPGGWRSKHREPAVERMVDRKLRAMTGRMGHVRTRWSSLAGGAAARTVDLFPDARKL